MKSEPKPSSASSNSSSASAGKTKGASDGASKKKTDGKGSIASMFASVGKKGDGDKKTATEKTQQPSKQKVFVCLVYLSK